MVEIAASADPLPERAQGLLECLHRWAPSDASWLALSDPRSHVYATAASSGLDRSVLEYLDRPAVAQEIELTGLNRNQPPVSVSELPVPVEDLPTWTECLTPAGFRGGLGVPLFEPGGLLVGLLGLLSLDADPPFLGSRDPLGQVAPLIARGLSPMRSLLVAARIVQGATAGVVVLGNGSMCPLPGMEDHALLVEDSPVVQISRCALLSGQLYRSFMWPARATSGHAGHVRVSVLAATTFPALAQGMILVTPDADSRGLTPRELEVLGMVVDGRSNQQIASRLSVAPRTVAAHVEHLLGKLKAPTRTVAAVRAEREGCYIPQLPALSQPHQIAPTPRR